MRGSWPLRLLVPAVIVAALIIDIALGESDTSLADPVAVKVVNEVAVPSEEILTSTWFCPVVHMRNVLPPGGAESDATEEAEEFIPLEVDAEILISNISDRSVQVLLELNSTRDRESLSIVIAPRQVRIVDVTEVEVEPGELMSAVVEVAGGGVAVTRRLVSPWGVDQARCSSTVSTQWLIPMGDTQADSRDLVVIHNPLPRHSVVDVSLASEVEPGAFNVPELQGVVIPGRSAKVIDIAEFARRRTVASATVSVRTGRVAVDHLAVYSGSVGREGFSTELAIPNASEFWWLPLPGIDDLTHTIIRVVNPNEELAEVEVSATSGGEEPFADSASVIVLPNDVTEIRLATSSVVQPDSHTLLAVAGGPVAVSVRAINELAIAVAVEVLIGDSAKPSLLGDLAEQDANVPEQTEPEPDETPAEEPGEVPVDQEPVDQDPTDAEGPSAEDELAEEEPIEDEFAEEELVEDDHFEQGPPLIDALAGLTSVPGHTAPSTRWLLVTPPDPDASAFLTLMAVPPPADSEAEDPDAEQQEPAPAVVVLRLLSGERLAEITVPASGAVTEQLPRGTVFLLESEVPVVPVVYSYVSQAHGLTGVVALPY